MPEHTPGVDDAPKSSPPAPYGASATPVYHEAVTRPPESPDQGPGRGKRRWWVWVLVALLVAGGFWFLSRRAQDSAAKSARAARAPRAVPIVTATVKKGSIDVYLTALGIVTPVNTVTVTSRVQGQIMTVAFREGQMVRKGAPLLTIDPRPYQAALTQVEGQLDHDQAVLEEARIDFDRYKAANARNAIPKQQLDDQEKVVQQDEGTVKNDRGMVDNAKVNLEYCTISSPIDGRVGLRLVDPGNIVLANSTTGLLVITQLQPITVVMSIAEDYLPQIQEQLRQGRKLVVDAFDRTQQKQLASGELQTLDNVIDTTTGTVKLKAIFPNADGMLFANQFVNARLLVSTEQGVNLVPTAAIQRNAQGAFVYVIAAGTAESRPVTVGTSEGTQSAVTGVEAGEVVAVNGFDKLLDGVKVTTALGGGAGGGGRGAGGGGRSGGGRSGHHGHGGQSGQSGQPGQTGETAAPAGSGQPGQPGQPAAPSGSGQPGPGGQHKHHRPAPEAGSGQ
jgi:multidrug efflux system membrane fusion protein